MPAVAMDMRAGGTVMSRAEVRRRPGRTEDDNLEENCLYNCPVIISYKLGTKTLASCNDGLSGTSVNTLPTSQQAWNIILTSFS